MKNAEHIVGYKPVSVAGRMNSVCLIEAPITADTALRLGKWLGTGPELWLNLQKTFELDQARAAIGDELAAIPSLKKAKRAA